MHPRTSLRRHDIDLAPIGPWRPSGWYGVAIPSSTTQHTTILQLLRGRLVLLLLYFEPLLLLWLVTLVPSGEGHKVDRP